MIIMVVFELLVREKLVFLVKKNLHRVVAVNSE